MFGPTEIRILLAIGNLALLKHPVVKVLGMRFLLFDVGGTVAIMGITIMLIVSAVAHVKQLYREETIA